MRDLGAVNVQLNPPALVDLHDVLSFVVPKVIDTLADGAKPLPVRVTCVPMGPLVGFADMDGVLTPKVRPGGVPIRICRGYGLRSRRCGDRKSHLERA